MVHLSGPLVCITKLRIPRIDIRRRWLGTGKTESVKALGNALGRFVLVFNCDEAFDFQAMGRIFVGLCQVGAWGCFDEFNRLEERMLSAVSQQIQTIQEALRQQSAANKSTTLSPFFPQSERCS